jgi:hypothetical protein
METSAMKVRIMPCCIEDGLFALAIDDDTGAVIARIAAEPGQDAPGFHAAMQALDAEYDPDDHGHGGPPKPPGYPGPCPGGVPWEQWLAQNNVD